MDTELITWITSILGELKGQNDQVLKNQEKIIEKVEQISDNLQKLNSKFDEQILRDARIGVRHLVDGINSGVGKARENEFFLARQKFANLVELDSNQTTSGTSGTVDNKGLISLGYYGNFHYFNLIGDKRSAAIQVYECILNSLEWGNLLYVLHSLEIFPTTFLGQDYAESIYRLMGSQNSSAKPEGGKLAGFLGGAGLFGGLTAIATSLLFPPAAFAGLSLWVISGAIGTASLLGGTWGTASGGEQGTNSEAEQLKKKLEGILNHLQAECRTRLKILQKTTSDELLGLAWKGKILPFVDAVEKVLLKNDKGVFKGDKAELKNRLTNLLGSVDKGNINGAELALFDIGNFLRGLSGVTQEFSTLVEEWNGLVSQLGKSGLLRS